MSECGQGGSAILCIWIKLCHLHIRDHSALRSDTGPVSLATYSVADQMYRAVQTLYAPVVQALYPYMIRTRDLRALRSILLVSLGICIVGASVTVLWAGTLVRLLIGPGYGDTALILTVLAVTLCAVVPSALLGYPLLGAFGRARWANSTVIAGAAIQMCLFGYLMWSHAVTGLHVAVTVLATEFSVLGLRTWLVVRLTLRRSNGK